MKNLFPSRLKELLAFENITQKDFAEKIGVSPSCVCFWLKGERQPTAENLFLIAKAFNISSDYLLGLSDI